MKSRRTYTIKPITINDVRISEVVIDPHYEARHIDSVNDGLILNLVMALDGRFEIPETRSGPYAYFATLVEFEDKKYRLVWLLEDDAIYVGVVNAYRDKRRK